MCDWEEGDFAEYLLWVEAQAVPSRARARGTKAISIAETGTTEPSVRAEAETAVA